MSQEGVKQLLSCLKDQTTYKDFKPYIDKLKLNLDENFQNMINLLQLVDQVIGNPQYTPMSRLLSLRLLKDCMSTQNEEMRLNIQESLLKVVKQFASKPNGNNILVDGINQQDKSINNTFYLMAQQCIKYWALYYPINPQNNKESQFLQAYSDLINKQIIFIEIIAPNKPIFKEQDQPKNFNLEASQKILDEYRKKQNQQYETPIEQKEENEFSITNLDQKNFQFNQLNKKTFEIFDKPDIWDKGIYQQTDAQYQEIYKYYNNILDNHFDNLNEEQMTLLIENTNKNMEIIELLQTYDNNKDYNNLRVQFRNKILPTLKYKSENQQQVIKESQKNQKVSQEIQRQKQEENNLKPKSNETNSKQDQNQTPQVQQQSKLITEIQMKNKQFEELKNLNFATFDKDEPIDQTLANQFQKKYSLFSDYYSQVMNDYIDTLGEEQMQIIFNNLEQSTLIQELFIECVNKKNFGDIKIKFRDQIFPRLKYKSEQNANFIQFSQGPSSQNQQESKQKQRTEEANHLQFSQETFSKQQDSKQKQLTDEAKCIQFSLETQSKQQDTKQKQQTEEAKCIQFSLETSSKQQETKQKQVTEEAKFSQNKTKTEPNVLKENPQQLQTSSKQQETKYKQATEEAKFSQNKTKTEPNVLKENPQQVQKNSYFYENPSQTDTNINKDNLFNDFSWDQQPPAQGAKITPQEQKENMKWDFTDKIQNQIPETKLAFKKQQNNNNNQSPKKSNFFSIIQNEQSKIQPRVGSQQKNNSFMQADKTQVQELQKKLKLADEKNNELIKLLNEQKLQNQQQKQKSQEEYQQKQQQYDDLLKLYNLNNQKVQNQQQESQQKQQNDQLLKLLNDYQIENQQQKQSIEEYKIKLLNLENQNLSQKDYIELQNKISMQENQIQEQQNKISMLENQIQDLKQSLSVKLNTITQSQDQKLDNLLIEKDSKIKSLEREYEYQQKNNKQKDQKIEKIMTELQKLKLQEHASNKLQEDLYNSKKQLLEKEDRIQELEKQLKSQTARDSKKDRNTSQENRKSRRIFDDEQKQSKSQQIIDVQIPQIHLDQLPMIQEPQLKEYIVEPQQNEYQKEMKGFMVIYNPEFFNYLPQQSLNFKKSCLKSKSVLFQNEFIEIYQRTELNKDFLTINLVYKNRGNKNIEEFVVNFHGEQHIDFWVKPETIQTPLEINKLLSQDLSVNFEQMPYRLVICEVSYRFANKFSEYIGSNSFETIQFALPNVINKYFAVQQIQQSEFKRTWSILNHTIFRTEEIQINPQIYGSLQELLSNFQNFTEIRKKDGTFGKNCIYRMGALIYLNNTQSNLLMRISLLKGNKLIFQILNSDNKIDQLQENTIEFILQTYINIFQKEKA